MADRVGLTTEVRSESEPEDAELAQARSADSALNLPQQPAAPDGGTIRVTQAVLRQQAARARATGAKSTFRVLLEAGHANVHGWWCKNGRLRYAVKCLTDIPKGFLQGLFSGFGIGLFCLAGTALVKGRLSEDDNEAHYLACYGIGFRGNLRLRLLKTLGTESTLRRAESVRAIGHVTGQRVGTTRAFATAVKDSGDVTYTPSKVVTFGMGAAIGAVVPSLLALIGYGIADLVKTREPEQAGSESSVMVTGRGAIGASDPRFREDSDV